MILNRIEDMLAGKEAGMLPGSISLVFRVNGKNTLIEHGYKGILSACASSVNMLNITGKERDEIVDELNRLENIECLQIAEINKTGSIIGASTETLAVLENAGLHGELLTREEVQKLADFIRAEPGSEGERVKLSMILDTAANAGNHECADSDNKRERAIADRIADKYQRYLCGDIDTGRRFDVSPYVRGDRKLILSVVEAGPYRDSDDFEDRSVSCADWEYFLRDMGVDRTENILESLDDDELLEYGIVSPDELFVCGPYTAADARDISALPWKTCFGEIRSDYLDDVINDAVRDCGQSMEDKMARDFLRKTVTENRRPNARTMMLLFAGLGLSYIKMVRHRVPQFKNLSPDVNALSLTLRMCSLCAGKFFGWTPSYMKNTYSAARPISEKFFRAVEGKIRDMTPVEISAREEKYTAELTRMYDYLIEANSLFEMLSLRLDEFERRQREQLAGEVKTA